MHNLLQAAFTGALTRIPKTITGIALSETQLTLAVIHHRGNLWRTIHHESHETPTWHDTLSTYHNTLKQLSHQHQKRIVIGLPNTHIISHTLTFSKKLKQATIAKYLTAQCDTLFDASAENCTHIIYPLLKENDKQHYFVAAVSNALLDTLRQPHQTTTTPRRHAIVPTALQYAHYAAQHTQSECALIQLTKTHVIFSLITAQKITHHRVETLPTLPEPTALWTHLTQRITAHLHELTTSKTLPIYWCAHHPPHEMILSSQPYLGTHPFIQFNPSPNPLSACTALTYYGAKRWIF